MARSFLRSSTILLAAVLTAGLLTTSVGCLSAHAKKKGPDPSAQGDKDKKDDASPFKEWDKTLKDAEKIEGLFTIHRKHEDVWFELRPDQLGKPFLMVSSLSSGLGKGRLLGGMPLDTELWEFQRVGNKVQIRIKNARFRADEGTPMSRAVSLSYGDSVLASAKIVSIHKETNNLLLDMDEVMIADLPGIGPALKEFLGGPASFDKDRTAITAIKGFPKNVEIDVLAVFISAEAKPIESVSDPRYLPLGVHYSLSELPENGYRPRLADDRVGYFLTVIKDFSRDASDTFFTRYINRWNLEKQDPTAALSPPKEPIVFYLDRTIPDEYRPYVRNGLLMWNKAFEKAGFKDAIVAKDAPDDPDFHPEDVRYNTIRWITSTEPAFGAIGPSRVDPRNGHILDADILVEAAMVQNVRRGYRNYIRMLTPEMPSATSPFGWGSGPGSPSGPDWRAIAESFQDDACNFADGVELGAAVDAALFHATGEIEPGGTVPEEYIGHFLHWVISHEVGHTLGLRHNFRASAATPHGRLHDVGWTRERGLYNSVMEYPAPNIALDRSRQGDYYTQVVGDYDVWAIQYGYTPIDASTPEGELPALRKIAELSMRPGLEYGTDTDAFAGPLPIGVDPDVNQFDLGSDPLAYGKDRLALIQHVRGKIHTHLTAPGEGYDRLRNTFESLVAAQGQALQIVAKQIGGLHTSRAHKGDPGERPAFAPVTPERQREAMSVIISSGFSDAAWDVPPALLASLQPSHWWHWGVDSARSIPLNYPYGDRILDVQNSLLSRLTHPILLSRIRETEASRRPAGAYTLAEHFRLLTEGIFSELEGSPRGSFEISPQRRNLGRSLLDRLIVTLNFPPSGMPEDARSLARMHLGQIDKRMGSVLSGRGARMDETTRAFLEESRARIRRALDAQSMVIG